MSFLDRQEKLLREYLDRDLTERETAEQFVINLDNLVESKSAGDQIDFRLEPLWQSARPQILNYAPGRVIKQIDTALGESIEAALGLRLSDTDKVVFLVGAGASVPSPSNIPAVRNLLPELWNRGRRIGRDDIDRLADWCQNRGVTNIEDLLTAAYVANLAAKSESITALLDYFLFSRFRDGKEGSDFRRSGSSVRVPDVNSASVALLQDTLQTLFGLLTSTMIEAEPNAAHQAIASFVAARPGTKVLTTNYDGCLDQAIASLSATPEVVPSQSVTEGNSELIKMHGSINWSYCDSCQDVRAFNLVALKAAYFDDSASYPILGICRHCQGLRRPLLVPPLSIKFTMFPNLVSLWDRARVAIEDATIIVVVGYSFAEADTYITQMVFRALGARSEQRMIIVDTDMNLVPQLRKRLTNHIREFDKARIVPCLGSCDIVVPRLLSALTSPIVPRTTRTSRSRDALAG
ncbi:MAG: hypothetical protein QOF71_1342 [Candidatus Eremiobacteraeota bacterium]|jgi:NAD-dependent SIR2 family protein deacetylase|nr:hypothetical protein [Candidatus Eremiobacteraeota bacterium]